MTQIIEEINATNYQGGQLDTLKAAEDYCRIFLGEDECGKGWLVEIDSREALVSRQWALLSQSAARAKGIVIMMVAQGAFPGLASDEQCEYWVAGMTDPEADGEDE